MRMSENKTNLDRLPSVDWDDRERLLREDETLTDEQRELMLGYMDHVSEGGKTKTFLVEKKIAWGEMNKIVWGRPVVQALMQEAKRRFDAVRGNAMIEEAYRRAVEGVDEPVYQKGVKVGHIKRHSDNLLMFLLKASFPEHFTERKEVKHSGTVVRLNVENVRRGSTPPVIEAEVVKEGDDDGDTQDP